MVNINLLPWREELQDERQKEILSLAAVVGVCAIVVVVVMHLIFAGWVEKQSYRNNFLQTEMNQANQQRQELQSYEDKHKQITIQINTIRALQNSRLKLVRLLDELARILPKGILITKIRQEEDIIDIQGYAESNSEVNDLIRKIARSEYFTEPELNEVIESNSRIGASRFRLQLQSNEGPTT